MSDDFNGSWVVDENTEGALGTGDGLGKDLDTEAHGLAVRGKVTLGTESCCLMVLCHRSGGQQSQLILLVRDLRFGLSQFAVDKLLFSLSLPSIAAAGDNQSQAQALLIAIHPLTLPRTSAMPVIHFSPQ